MRGLVLYIRNILKKGSYLIQVAKIRPNASGFHLFMSRVQHEFLDLISELPLLTPPPVTPVVSVEPTPVPSIEIESDEEFKVF